MILGISLVPLAGSCREAGVNVVGEGKTYDTGSIEQVEADTPAVADKENETADDEEPSPSAGADTPVIAEPADAPSGVKEDMKEDIAKNSNIPPIDADRPAVTETATFSLG